MSERDVEQPTYDELVELVASLRAEIARLRAELVRTTRDRHEVPPHYR